MRSFSFNLASSASAPKKANATRFAIRPFVRAALIFLGVAGSSLADFAANFSFIGSAASQPARKPPPQAAAESAQTAGWNYFFTCTANTPECVDIIGSFNEQLKSLGVPAPEARLFVRVVIDDGVAVARDPRRPDKWTYTDLVERLARISQVVPSIDSQSMKKYDPEGYAGRYAEMVNAFGKNVSVWEICNECNGNWLGPNAAENTIAAASAIRRLLPDAELLVTGFHYADRPDDVWKWFAENIPSDVRHKISNFGLSCYEKQRGACGQLEKMPWLRIVAGVNSVFPNVQSIGYTEVDDEDPKTRTPEEIRKASNLPGMNRFATWYVQDYSPAQRAAIHAGIEDATAADRQRIAQRKPRPGTTVQLSPPLPARPGAASALTPTQLRAPAPVLVRAGTLPSQMALRHMRGPEFVAEGIQAATESASLPSSAPSAEDEERARKLFFDAFQKEQDSQRARKKDVDLLAAAKAALSHVEKAYPRAKIIRPMRNLIRKDERDLLGKQPAGETAPRLRKAA
jgi:hypothetical protein